MSYIRNNSNTEKLYVWETGFETSFGTIEQVGFTWGSDGMIPVYIASCDFNTVMETYINSNYKGEIINTKSFHIAPCDEGIKMVFSDYFSTSLTVHISTFEMMAQEYKRQLLKNSFWKRLQFLFNPTKYCI